MTKNLHEPSTPRAVATNRYTGKLTQQKPYAYEWVTPVNDADCAAAQADPVTPWTPCYLNDWEQPTTLEPLSVRLNADGLLQWQGYVNSQNATAAIAFIMPGTLGGEPDMIPDVSVAENLSYSVFVTPDDGTTITQGRAYVDSTTGEVTITSTSTTIDSAWMLQNSGQTIANNSTTNLTNYDDFLDGVDITTNTTTGKLSANVTGIYLIEGNVLWSGTFAGGKMVRISANGGQIVQNLGNPSNWCSEEDTGTNNDFVQVQFLVFVFDVAIAVDFQL